MPKFICIRKELLAICKCTVSFVACLLSWITNHIYVLEKNGHAEPGNRQHKMTEDIRNDYFIIMRNHHS